MIICSVNQWPPKEISLSKAFPFPSLKHSELNNWVGVCLVAQSCLFVTPQTVACHAPLSMEFSRQEYRSGQPFPSPGIFLTQRQNPVSCIAGRFFLLSEPRMFCNLLIANFSGEMNKPCHPESVPVFPSHHFYIYKMKCMGDDEVQL